MSTKELAVIPPNAELITEDKGAGIKVFNGALMVANILPFPLFVDFQHLDSLNPMSLLLASIFSVALTGINMTAPQGHAIYMHYYKKDKIGFKKFAKLRLSRMPFISHFVNDEIKWTHRESGEMMTVIDKGTVSVYHLTKLDPKKIWDSMYLQETGENIDFSIDRLNAANRSLESRKMAVPTESQKRNFLTILLGS